MDVKDKMTALVIIEQAEAILRNNTGEKSIVLPCINLAAHKHLADVCYELMEPVEMVKGYDFIAYPVFISYITNKTEVEIFLNNSIDTETLLRGLDDLKDRIQ